MAAILINRCTVVPMTACKEAKYFTGSVGIEGNKIALVEADGAACDCGCTPKGIDRVEAFRRRHAGSLTEIDGRGKILMPGLVNTHCHVSMTLMRGYADDIPLMKWLYERIWPFESHLTHDDVRLGAELGIAEMLLAGTTTFVDMYWMEAAVAEAVIALGIRAQLGASFTDANYDAFEADLERVVAIARDPASQGRIEPIIAPHAPYSCSPGNLQASFALADRYGIGVTTHVSETLDEQRQIAERYGKTPTEHLRDLGFFDRRALAVHGVHLSGGDIEILHTVGASLAHNPQSNMKLSSGAAPVARMLEAGVNVSLGTDGTCSNDDLDLWEEMRSASFLQKLVAEDPCVLPAYQVLEMATVNGARAIGRQDLGQIAEGMTADVILIDGEKPHLYPRHDLIANLVYCAKAADVDTVIVDGRIVVEGGRIPGVDIGELCARVDRRAHELAGKH